jgi:hypothetical protein
MTSAKDAILALCTTRPPCQPVSPLSEKHNGKPKAVDRASVWLCVNDIASSYLGRRIVNFKS